MSVSFTVLPAEDDGQSVKQKMTEPLRPAASHTPWVLWMLGLLPPAITATIPPPNLHSEEASDHTHTSPYNLPRRGKTGELNARIIQDLKCELKIRSGILISHPSARVWLYLF